MDFEPKIDKYLPISNTEILILLKPDAELKYKPITMHWSVNLQSLFVVHYFAKSLDTNEYLRL